MTDKITISSPDDLGAAVPYLIGYTPTPGDLILVTFRADRSLGFCARIPRGVDMAFVEDLPNVCRRNGIAGCVVILWDHISPAGVDAALALGHLLDGSGIEVMEVMSHTPTPDVPAVVAELIAETGAAPVASREAMEAEFAPTHDGWADEVADVVAGLAVVAHRDAALRQAAANGNDYLRDYADMLTRALVDRPADAEPGLVANLAGTVAAVWYLIGDGGRANVAVDIGRAADPDNELCTLLDTAFRSGIQPSELRGLIEATA